MNSKRNDTFTILSAIGIILILLGHLDLGILSFGGIFPYYSYHVMIFVFIAGYFYKPADETHIGAFLLRKAKRLLLPYFIWNLIYGLISIALRKNGFVFAGELNLYNLFVAPFMGGHQFGLNAAAWFVPALFLLEVIDILVRFVLGAVGSALVKKSGVSETEENKDVRDNDTSVIYGTRIEWLVMALYLAVGVAAVWLSQRGSVYDVYRFPARLMLMAPTLQFGRLYKTRLEKYDITPWFIYFPLIFVMNYILNHVHGGLAYSTVWVTGFAGTPLTPFITTLTGIALWLRISKILSKVFVPDDSLKSEDIQAGETVLGDSNFCMKVLCGIGTHTFDIMMHHLAVFMVIKGLFDVLGQKTGWFTDFDAVAFKEDLYYTYVPGGAQWVKLIYLVLGLLIPIGIGIIQNCYKEEHNGKA